MTLRRSFGLLCLARLAYTASFNSLPAPLERIMSEYRMPNLLQVGAQKSGSEAPDIFGSAPKELNYFNRQDRNDTVNAERYKQHFRRGAERYYLESTPHYFRLPITAKDYSGPVTRDVAAAIKATVADDDLRLIAVLRNPVERALSATVHHMAQNRLPGEQLIRTAIDEHGILARGYYQRILEHWKSVFGDALAVFFYDELLANPLQFFRSITSWLEIDDTFLHAVDLNARINSSHSLAERSTLKIRPRATIGLIEELVELYRSDVLGLFSDCGVHYENWLSVDAVAEKWC